MPVRQSPGFSRPPPDRPEHRGAGRRPPSLHLLSMGPGPNGVPAAAPPEATPASEFDLPSLNLADVVDAQAELGCVLNVPRLADEPVDARVVIIVLASLHV